METTHPSRRMLSPLQQEPLNLADIKNRSTDLAKLYPEATVAEELLTKVGAFDKKTLAELGPEFSGRYWRRICKILASVAEKGRKDSGKRLQDMFLANRDNPKKAVEQTGLFLTGELPADDLMAPKPSQAKALYVLNECGHFSCIMDVDLARESTGAQDRNQQRRVVGDLPDFYADPLLSRLLLMLRQEHRESGGRNVEPYPIKTDSVSEVRTRVRDTSSRGLTRSSYPHISSMITAKTPLPEDPILTIESAERVGAHHYRHTTRPMQVLDGMHHVWSRLIETYPMEEAALLFDVFTHQNQFKSKGGEIGLSELHPSLTACQVFRPKDSEPLKLKTLLVGEGAAVVVSQGKKVDFRSIFDSEEILVDVARQAGYDEELPAQLDRSQREELMNFVVRDEARKAGLQGLNDGVMTNRKRSKIISAINSKTAKPKVELVVHSTEEQANEHLGSEYQGAHKVTEHEIPDQCTVLIVPPALVDKLKTMKTGDLDRVLSNAASEGRSIVGALTSELRKDSKPGESTTILSHSMNRKDLEVLSPYEWNEQDIERPEITAVVDHMNRLSGDGIIDLKLQFGHIHSDRPPVKDQLMTATFSSWLLSSLRRSGVEVEPLTLVDNLHVPDSMNYDKYGERLSDAGLAPNRVLLEDALPISYLATGICQRMMADQELKPRIKQLGGAVFLELDETNVTLYEGVDQKDAEGKGRVACVPFNLAFDLYLHNTEAVDILFFEQLERFHNDSTLMQWHRDSPDLSYHQLIGKHICSVEDPVSRKALKDRVLTPIRPPIQVEALDSTPFVDKVVDGYRDALEQNRTPVVAYVIEDFYLAQWEKYMAFFNAATSTLPTDLNFDVIRIAMNNTSGGIKALSAKHGDLTSKSE